MLEKGWKKVIEGLFFDHIHLTRSIFRENISEHNLITVSGLQVAVTLSIRKSL